MDAHEQIDRLAKVADDLQLDSCSVHTLIAWINEKAEPSGLNPAFISSVVRTVNESLARHLVVLNETAQWAEDNAS